MRIYRIMNVDGSFPGDYVTTGLEDCKRQWEYSQDAPWHEGEPDQTLEFDEQTEYVIVYHDADTWERV